jgi:2,3-diketo-5-methylthio-1-phosphopentane phosphatase
MKPGEGERTAMSWIVVCDFDGTIAREDTTDVILSECADGGWRDIEGLWESGAIDSRECMRRQVELITQPIEAVDRVIDRLDIDPSFPRFVQHCAELAIPIAITSDGIDHVIRRMLARYELDDMVIIANRLTTKEDGVLTLLPGFGSRTEGCGMGVCKCGAIALLREATDATRCLYIGDGRSDYCAAVRSADAVYAKPRLAAYCEAEGVDCTPFESFADVIPALKQFVTYPTVATERQLESDYAGT